MLSERFFPTLILSLGDRHVDPAAGPLPVLDGSSQADSSLFAPPAVSNDKTRRRRRSRGRTKTARAHYRLSRRSRLFSSFSVSCNVFLCSRIADHPRCRVSLIGFRCNRNSKVDSKIKGTVSTRKFCRHNRRRVIQSAAAIWLLSIFNDWNSKRIRRRNNALAYVYAVFPAWIPKSNWKFRTMSTRKTSTHNPKSFAFQANGH